MSWAPHGQWRIRILGGVLIYEVTGAWNEQGTRQFCKAARRAAAELVGTQWAVFGNLLDWDLATPEAIDTISDLTRDALASGCVMQSLVFGGNDLLRYCIDRMVPADLPNFERVLADSVEQALDALELHGFCDAALIVKRRGLDAILEEGLVETLGV